MTTDEIYQGLRIIVNHYIAEPKQTELLLLLTKRESAGDFPPGKGIIACVSSDSNGVRIKPEHQQLWNDLCWHCI
jgi:hypothetical protein